MLVWFQNAPRCVCPKGFRTRPDMGVSEIRGTLLGPLLQGNPAIWGSMISPYFRKPPIEIRTRFRSDGRRRRMSAATLATIPALRSSIVVSEQSWQTGRAKNVIEMAKMRLVPDVARTPRRDGPVIAGRANCVRTAGELWASRQGERERRP